VQLPEEQAAMVTVLVGPANLYRVFDPSAGIVIVTVQDGRDDIV